MTADERRAPRTPLNTVDAAILEFAERWAPFGGGHEFIFPEFGIRIDEFYDRLGHILNQIDPQHRRSALTDAVRRNYPFWRPTP
ncbi:hypothetical protein [Rhodococcoides kyotonense]|uniref:DUF3263 domain-containing protein n=1 Tax=Rhodococcoides kyotonense TaxID=398843 RepID=A0A177Y6V7_9NOCA|nr:hypothetical protein [Rhodococcus kyotonensis]OAK51234.1 hypothetical protein A3K89_13575 [Rhodococcus kyotonensis]